MRREKEPKRLNMENSMRLFMESLKLFPAGVNSNARIRREMCPSFAPCTLFIKRAHGSHIWDVDGNKYIDYRLGYGPVILGHSYEAVRQAVHRHDKDGLVFALENEIEIKVAHKVQKCLPSMELMRFANSGTEATMAAIRVARAFTGKEKIMKFHGHYHGWHDSVMFSTEQKHKKYGRKIMPASLGVPSEIKKLVLVEDWNNFAAVEKTLKRHHRNVAAIITEPIMGNAAAIMPHRGYLKHLRELCDRYDVALIFDEVKTGFRVGLGGAQKMFRVRPDLTTVAKSLGNGYPIAAFGGREDMMNMIRPGKVAHGGTYSANPVSLTAASTVLDVLMKKPVFKRLNWYGRRMMAEIGDMLSAHGVSHIVQGVPEMFQFLFTRREEISNYNELQECDMILYAAFQYEMMRRGVMFDEDGEEPIYVSYSHSKKDLEDTLDAFEDSLHDALIPRTPVGIDTRLSEKVKIL